MCNKTLKDLGLDKHKTGNYADYVKGTDLNMVCCGWMDIHNDKDNLGDSGNPFFTVKPLFWHRDAIFAFKNGVKWSFLDKKGFVSRSKTGGVKIDQYSFKFDARKQHGLVPKQIVDLIKNNSNFYDLGLYLKFSEDCCNLTSPKLVWQWIYDDARHN